MNHTTTICIPVSRISTSRNPVKSSTSRSSADHESRSKRVRLKATQIFDTDTWIARLDPYLPLELRSQTWQDNLTNFEGVRSVESLPELLVASNAVFSTGILTHIALVQRRWDAVLYICQAIFQSDRRPGIQPINPLKGSPWSTLQAAGPLLDIDFFEPAVHLWNVSLFKEPGNPLQGELPLDRVTQTPFEANANVWEPVIGQVWRCLGHVMLAATREQSSLQVDMTGFVLQIIAAMHSNGLISESIYLFEATDVPTTIRKSPFLHLMSSRIMTSVSDTVWKKLEPDLMRNVAYVVAKHAHESETGSEGDFSPRLKPLKHEVWLEFILWSCIHGGHFKEGVEIVNSMNAGDKNQRWSTVPWYVLQDILDEKLVEQQDIRNARSWYERLASSLEGYSEDPPLLDLGRNTVSCEVVTRLCDGMLSTLAHPAGKEWSLTKSAANCMDLLGPVSTPMDYSTRQSLLYRLAGGNMSNILDMANNDPSDFKRRWKYEDDDLELQQDPSLAIQPDADPLHSILVNAMVHHVEKSDINAALRSYEQLKLWSGNLPRKVVSLVGHDLSDRASPLLSQLMDIKFLLPSSIWTSFLDLLFDSRMLKTARTILASLRSTTPQTTIDLVDQGSSAIPNTVIQDAAPSSNDSDSLRILASEITTGRVSDQQTFSEALHSQILQNDWNMARNLLISMTSYERIRCQSLDIAKIAARVMRLRAEGNPEDSTKLQELLAEILDGQYRKPQVPGATPDWSEARYLNQTCRVLASLPDPYFADLAQYAVESGQASNPVPISTPTLNILLEAIVENFGMEAGRAFAQLWCIRRTGKSKKTIGPEDSHFPCFRPSLTTLRTIISPFTSHFRQFYKDPHIPTGDRDSGESSSRSKDQDEDQGRIGAASHQLLIERYYDEYGREEYLPTLSWVMTLCKEYKFDEKETFYTLLQPMEEIEGDVDDGIHRASNDGQYEERTESNPPNEE